MLLISIYYNNTFIVNSAGVTDFGAQLFDRNQRQSVKFSKLISEIFLSSVQSILTASDCIFHNVIYKVQRKFSGVFIPDVERIKAEVHSSCGIKRNKDVTGCRSFGWELSIKSLTVNCHFFYCFLRGSEKFGRFYSEIDAGRPYRVYTKSHKRTGPGLKPARVKNIFCHFICCGNYRHSFIFCPGSVCKCCKIQMDRLSFRNFCCNSYGTNPVEIYFCTNVVELKNSVST